MDFGSSELRYRDGERVVVVSLRTFDGSGSARVVAVRIARKTQIESSALMPIEVAVNAVDGERGIFVPTRHVGAIMIAATVTTVRNGKALVPAINSNSSSAKLPSKKQLGTWIPLDDDVQILQMNGELSRSRVNTWISELGHTSTPLKDENEVKVGIKNKGARELVVKLLRAYRNLTANEGDCPPTTVLDVQHHIDTGDTAPIQ
ncbi:hypothetical protein F441_10401 [Phytophthora nicotianae CJ01A1]|uniref:Uncharacterized protein n=2 Tax=Phytophthora nicotianae TaxID=4792 RepID=W2WVY5_PHYNI|nr:hypothetical protein L915_10222 [Phytophthora nicotianae]ETP14681.1 hypothetical protein F441_10401 [Phytophthora nicotianae CJ01A1]